MLKQRPASTMKDGRTFARYLDGSRIEYRAEKCGHVYTIDHSKGKISKRLGPTAAQMMASWWSEKKGGCIAVCPICERSEKRKQKLDADSKSGPPRPRPTSPLAKRP